jgi:hypothetical protein
MQQWHKESISKGTATSRKWEDIRQELKEGSRSAEPSREMNVKTIWRGRPPPKQEETTNNRLKEPWM